MMKNDYQDAASKEFHKMLEDFINSEFEKDPEDVPDMTDTENDKDDDLIDDDADLDDDPIDDADEEDVDYTIFPDGEIEQNGNISVKVDILKPLVSTKNI